jgi:hypothetical protein
MIWNEPSKPRLNAVVWAGVIQLATVATGTTVPPNKNCRLIVVATLFNNAS